MKVLTMDEITKLRADISVADLESAYAEALAFLPLAALRKKSGTTQVEMAARLGKSQAAVSKFEGRGDFLVSTLYRHVNAIGGKLDISIRTDRAVYELSPIDFGDEISFSLAERGNAGQSACLADHARQFASADIRKKARFGGSNWKHRARSSAEDVALTQLLAAEA